ncbi:aminoacetone oxidase family FAD-binding enzyme [Citrobacter freundii]|uniref:aminoacetone oxidase family FAD-binding enzyme n=1 Tax=Citrobacter freundii TaxID=546 RepID=UPI003CF04528
MERFDTVIIGAGAAGMFCAAQAGQAGSRVLLIDNGKKPGRKILMSGGGRCNFTNLYVEPAAYLSQNPHFCKSALARYTQWDFIDPVFRENLLFTHRGLSGPAVLQISSFWQPGEFVSINLLPDVDLASFLDDQRSAHPNQSLKNTLAMQLPKRLVECLQQLGQIPDVSLKQLNVRDQQTLVETLTDWRVQPNGTEGYRTAEVTLGGVDTNELSSRTMEARKVPGLYFIGEVMDVTGWLGGYNFQWAWSSAWACAQDLAPA